MSIYIDLENAHHRLQRIRMLIDREANALVSLDGHSPEHVKEALDAMGRADAPRAHMRYALGNAASMLSLAITCIRQFEHEPEWRAAEAALDQLEKGK